MLEACLAVGVPLDGDVLECWPEELGEALAFEADAAEENTVFAGFLPEEEPTFLTSS